MLPFLNMTIFLFCCSRGRLTLFSLWHQSASERILHILMGCLVMYQSVMRDWGVYLLRLIVLTDHLLLGIAAPPPPT